MAVIAAAALALFATGIYISWLWIDSLTDPQRRFSLGKARWPCGFAGPSQAEARVISGYDPYAEIFLDGSFDRSHRLCIGQRKAG